MIYIDTNVIGYAIENHPKYGNVCKKVLLDIQEGSIKACSSFLVLIELINVLSKINRSLPGKRIDIRRSIEAVLSLPFVWLDISTFTIERASEYTYNVSGADYMHIALMEINMVNSIISADKELDKVDIINRIDPLNYDRRSI